MNLLRFTSALSALAALAAPPAQTPAPLVPAARLPQANPGVLAAIPDLSSRAVLLPPGKTQGAFHLNGVVDAHKTVILRWGSDQGEMPTEGVIISRQKVGDTAWKELNPRKPVGFFSTDGLASRLKKLPQEKREGLYSLAYSNLARDPATGRRALLPAKAPKGAPATFSDVKPAQVTAQFKALRASGKLGASDLLMLTAQADLDPDAADAYGLVYKDQPGSGTWRYKIRVQLPEGGSVEAVCAKTFDPRVPTPIPPPQAVSATSANGAVRLNWKAAPVDTVAGYDVYRASDPNGPYRRLNANPVKMVALTVEEPALTLARASARGAVIARETKKVPPEQLTPLKVAEIRAMAADTVAAAPLPPLAPVQATALKEAVASGALAPGGPVKVLSLYTDSITDAGNTDLVNGRTYYYKIVSVDIGGAEGPLDGLAPVPGLPKDLQPPQVPGRPGLAQAFTALGNLHLAQAQRLKDPRLAELDQAVKAKAPGAGLAQRPLGPLLAAPAPAQPRPAMAVRPELAALSTGQVKQMKLSRTVATMPVKELAAVAAASVLTSLPDGSAPKADLVWAPSPDADLKSYTVYRATGKGPMAPLATTAAPSWQDATLEVGKAYTYAITATDQVGNESAQSPAWVLQVCDSALKTKLALQGLQGKVSTAPPAVPPGHRFLRPAGLAMATTSLAGPIGMPSMKLPPTASEPLVSPYAEPKAASARVAPSPALVRGLAPEPRPAAGLQVHAVEPKDLKVTAHVMAYRPLPARSFNPMLFTPPPPTELYVLLTWTRPLDGYPLTYTIQEAPQDVRLVSAGRGPVRIVPVKFGPAAPARPVALKLAPRVQPAAKVAAPAPGMIQSTPALHASAATRVMPEAAVEATARKDLSAHLEPLVGPGTFTLVSPNPVTTEAFVATFPVEAAQYGGATFYFQVQAHTLEFGRAVDGPVSAPVAVTLPDVVPPPIPQPGSLVLDEEASGAIDVGLAWLQATTPDLAGAIVERQQMAYQMVDGLPQATTALAPVQRLTPSPVAGLTYQDKGVPGGFYRYTLRSRDTTGNESATRGSLDILVPGEPFPAAPQGVLLSGDHLSWQAAANAGGYTVWRSYTGADGDFDCISPILAGAATSYDLPPQKKVFLRVVARSPSGMYQAPSDPVTHP